MRIANLLAIALAVPALAGCESVPDAVSPAHSASAAAEVILVSIDGYRADYLARGDSPVLQRLAADGVRAVLHRAGHAPRASGRLYSASDGGLGGPAGA